MKTLIFLFALVATTFAGPDGTFTGDQYTYMLHTPQNLYPVYVKVPQAQVVANSPMNSPVYPQAPSNMDDMMKMMLIQNMQLQNQQMQMNMGNQGLYQQQMYNQMMTAQGQQQTAQTRRKNRSLLKRMTTKGKVNNGLILGGIANEVFNKNDKYADQGKVRLGVAGGLFLNNTLR